MMRNTALVQIASAALGKVGRAEGSTWERLDLAAFPAPASPALGLNTGKQENGRSALPQAKTWIESNVSGLEV